MQNSQDSRPAHPILVVEDDPASLDLTMTFIREIGATPIGATTVREAISLLGSRGDQIALLVTDIKLHDGSGLDLLTHVRARLPHVPVILITAYGSTDEAVAAMREGALYYFTKPVDFALLARLVKETLEKQSLQAELVSLQARLGVQHDAQFFGSSRAIRAALEQGDAVARLDTTVLLLGETGTGKEVFAKYLHSRSQRKHGPLVTINCAALPEPLLESELFGHERGAFTGAIARKPGKFELAVGGTLVLDEVADMSLALQAKTLRAIELKQIEPLGATRSVHADVRIIAATNHDLPAAVREGRFREDLYYRLNVFPIVLPPLRERLEDVPVLATAFLQRYSTAFGKDVSGFSPAALDALQSYPWPGNVRELKHAIERAVILAKSPTIDLDALPRAVTLAPGSGPAGPPRSGRPLADIQREAILAALRESGGNRTKAARTLGLTRNQLQYWLRTKGQA
ncbi:MAG: sigma-54 dependent transcriptional regulator [Acidobacteriota bacterium]